MSLQRASSHRLRVACAVAAGVIAAFGGGCSRAEQPKTPPPNAAELNESLREAALAGELEKARTLLARGAAPADTNAEGRTALMLAAFNGHVEVGRLLLERGANVQAQDAMGRTALMYAASGPYEATVRLLLERGADANICDKDERWTALMFAAAEGQIAVVRALLSHGADPARTDIDGDKAVDFASRNGHAAVAALFAAPESKGK